jgi:copper homeostasis protein
MSEILLEVCVDDLAGLEAAISGGADRIELCSALSTGGLTPSAGLMSAAAKSSVPVYAMIRPRIGAFVYTQRELDLMCEDIQFAASAGISGVVIGANLPGGALDAKALRQLSNAVGRMPRTLHRAFDFVPDLSAAIELAVDYGFERILTSGRAKTAPEGLDDLAEAIRLADGRISIMPGSGVTPASIGQILDRLPVREVHGSLSTTVDETDDRVVSLGFSPHQTRRTDEATVRALKAALVAR